MYDEDGSDGSNASSYNKTSREEAARNIHDGVNYVYHKHLESWREAKQCCKI